MLIKELELFTGAFAATKHFYSKLMCLQIVDESATHVSFAAGNSVVRFVKMAEGHPFYHIAFGIPNNRLSDAMDWVNAFTSILPYSDTEQIADFKGWNAKAFYFHDNNGNILEFITHFDLGLHDKKPFSAASITGINEIGIVVDDVPSACRSITENYYLPLFENGPHLPDFSVIGNAHGMFIVSGKGRGWLPTHRPCEYHPLSVVVENNGHTSTIGF